ncbi:MULTISPECIES: condensation domain-containing protein, partial [Niastella]
FLVAHHDGLRMRYQQSENQWQQEYGSHQPAIQLYEIEAADEQTAAAAINNIGTSVQQSLDITSGELVRAVLMRMPAWSTHNRLLIVVHHLAIDGVSWRILLEDLDLLLSQCRDGKQLSIGPKSSSYRQWYEALHQYGKSRRLLSQQPYWEATRNNNSLLPVDKSHSGIIRKKEIRSYGIALDEQHTRQLLQTVPRVYRTEINDVLLSALTRTLSKWSKQQQILIGMEGHGREVINDKTDLSRTTGWFTTLYPLLLQAPQQDEASEWLMSIKEQLRQVPDKGIGYGVLKYINKAGALQAPDNWQIAFNYLGQLDNITRSSNWFSSANEAHGSSGSDENIVTTQIVINSMIYQGELHIQWSYSLLHYEESTVQQLAQSYIDDLQYLVDHCVSVPAGETITTPIDHYITAGVSYTELRRFMEEEENGLPRKRQLEALYPLSGLQQGMLFHGLYAKQEEAYVEQFTCSITGGMHSAAFKKTWAYLCRHHTILRTGFYYDAFSIPVQCAYRNVVPNIIEIDFRDKTADEQSTLITQYKQADRERGFMFRQAPLMRICLIRLADENYYMIWTFHHILLDGWSTPVLMQEFLETYELLIKGQEPPLQHEDRYEDYIQYLSGKDRFGEEAYWQNYLKEIASGTLLPFVTAGADRTKGVGQYGECWLLLDKDLHERIETFTKGIRVTLNTLMQAVWGYLLHQYTGFDNVIYGVVVSGRPEDLPNVEQRVGMYINTLPLRAAFRKDQSITAWLQQLQNEQLESRVYQYSGLNDIQSWAGIRGDLFDSFMVFENYPVSSVLSSRQWTFQVQDAQSREGTNYPLGISVRAEEEISILFKYNSNLLQEQYVQQIRNHFEQVLLQLVNGAATHTSAIRMLTTTEAQQLQAFSLPVKGAHPDVERSVMALFSEQVEQTPNAIALQLGEEQLSYQQLEAKSNQLAHFLRDKGVQQDSVVAVSMERSVMLIITLLGVLKTGCSYVAIDPAYPAQRKKYILEDSGAQLLLTHEATFDELPDGVASIDLAAQLSTLSHYADGPITTTTTGAALAYIMYTSGSTGLPKGVEVTHSNITSLVKGTDFVQMNSSSVLLSTG